MIDGFSDPKFNKLRDAYEKNFNEELDVGSSLGISLNGEIVVNLWGGYKDKDYKSHWEEDTIINVWSSTKNMASLCALLLFEKGLLDFDAPVTEYWPEFSENGKENILVKNIMSHSSGLSGWEEPIDYKDYYNWDKLCFLLAKQKPFWEPGTKVGYHSISVGYLIGEIVRRVSGKTIGKFFQDEIASPLSSDFHIGLDKENFDRVAEIFMPGDPSTEDLFDDMDESSPAYKTMANGILRASVANEENWRKAEIPAAGGHGNGKSIAECMGLIANNGLSNGVRVLSEKSLSKIFDEQIMDHDLVLDRLVRWGIGFGLPVKNDSWMGYFNNDKTCYWTGWGGSLSIADKQNRVALGYTPLRMEDDVFGEERTNNIVRSFVECIDDLGA